MSASDAEVSWDEDQPLVSKDEKPEEGSERPPHGSKSNGWRLKVMTKKQHIVHLGLMILYTLLSVVATYVFSEAKKSANYQHPTLFIRFHQSQYAGPPDSKIDQAWHDLLENMTIRVSKDELDKDNQSSVSLPEGGGYLAWPGVYHELHCVKLLRRWNYRDHYYPNLTTKLQADMEGHADHCLELLRQAAMCRADMSLTTFMWDENQTVPIFNPEEHIHYCMDWNTTKASLGDRLVSEGESDRLVNPLFQNFSSRTQTET